MNVVAFGVESAGWLGAGVLLLAYGLVSSSRLRAGGRAFQLMNLGGSAGLALSAGVHAAWPSATVNVLWMGIAAAALTRLALTSVRRASRGASDHCRAPGGVV